MVFMKKEKLFSQFPGQAATKQERCSGRDIALVKEEKWFIINSDPVAWAMLASARRGFVYMQMSFPKH